MKPQRIFVFGIDGATLDVILPAIEKGRLPNLGKIVKKGAWGTLQSTIHPITPMAWSSFATGVNAGRHGIFDFSKSVGEQLRLNSALDRKAPAIWTLLSRAGRSSIVLNVPFTYPAEQINGIMIPGFDAPKVDREIFHPASVYQELVGRFGEYQLDWTFPIGKKFDPEGYLQDVMRVIAYRGDTGLYLMENHPWDFFMTMFTSTDHVQHVFWKIPEGPAVIEKVYEAVDHQLGRFLNALPDNITVFVMSDHGAGGIECIFYLDNWLAQEGFLVKSKKSLKQIGLQALKSELRRIIPTETRKKLRYRFPGLRGRVEGTLSDQGIQWDKTRAYAFGMYGNIRINLKGREPFGIVSAEEYDAILEDISERMVMLTDPNTGERVVEAVYRKEDIYHGPYIDDAPDLVVRWRNYSYFTKKGIDRGEQIFADELMVDASEYPHTGTHRLEGVFMASGPNVRPVGNFEADIMDLAPTICRLMGVFSSQDFDGRVLADIFNEMPVMADGDSKRLLNEESDIELKSTVELADDEKSDMAKRLRSLGYI